MKTDFRALCAELADAYLRTLEHINNSTWLGYEPSDDPLLLRARAALADEPPEPAPPTDGEVAELPPRPPLMTPPVHPALERYGITWDGSPDNPLLTRMADGYWTPWHVAAELLQRQVP